MLLGMHCLKTVLLIMHAPPMCSTHVLYVLIIHPTHHACSTTDHVHAQGQACGTVCCHPPPTTSPQAFSTAQSSRQQSLARIAQDTTLLPLPQQQALIQAAVRCLFQEVLPTCQVYLGVLFTIRDSHSQAT